MLAPIKDAIHLVHGPVGCAYYGGTVRGKSYRIFTTAMEEKDVVFGGVKKLEKTLREAKLIMPHARCIFVYVTCTPAIIGDDVTGVCRRAEKELGCPVIVVNCPGFRGESQSKGHKIAYECLFKYIIGTRSSGRKKASRPLVDIIGDYNINGETYLIKSLLSRMGIDVHCVFTGEADIEKMACAHEAELNLLICQSSGRFLAEAMQKKYGIPYQKVSFFGLSRTCDSLRKIGAWFGLGAEAENLIIDETKKLAHLKENFISRLKGKKAALFFGAARMSMLMDALENDMQMQVVFTGSQFGDLSTYMEAWEGAREGTYLIDDASDSELEDLLHDLKPDVFMGGTKENFLSHKLGIGFVLFPQPKQAGPYIGFEGFANFVRDVYKAVYAPVWRLAF